MTDWEKELAKIDKQLASLSDDKLMAAADAQAAQPGVAPAGARGAKPQAAPARSAPPPVAMDRRSRWGLLGRVTLAAALGVAVLFWPYGTACGAPLFGYLAAVGVLGATGILAAVASWRHRAPTAHVISLVLILWAVVLGAAEVLPRTPTVAPDPAARAPWFCP